MPLAIRPRSSPVNSRPRKNRNKGTTNLAVNLPPDNNPVLITAATVSSPSLILTFNQPVVVDGLPEFSVDVGAGTVAQANQQSANVVELVFSEAITGATTLNIKARDPAIRGTMGGYVTSLAHTFA